MIIFGYQAGLGLRLLGNFASNNVAIMAAAVLYGHTTSAQYTVQNLGVTQGAVAVLLMAWRAAQPAAWRAARRAAWQAAWQARHGERHGERHGKRHGKLGMASGMSSGVWRVDCPLCGNHALSTL